MKNKIIFTVFIFGFVFSFFHTELSYSRSLVVWTSNERAAQAIEVLKLDFEKDFKAKVKIETLNKDLTQAFKTASLTGKGPDLFLWAHDVSGDLAQSGLIEPIDDTPLLQNNFLKISKESFRYQGKLYGYPLAVESVVLFYNKDLLKNPPQTMEEILSVDFKKKLIKPSQYIFLYDIKNFFFSYPLLNAQGGYIFPITAQGLQTKEIGLDHPGFYKGFELLKNLVDKKIIPSSTDRSISFEKFKSGNLALTIDGPWAMSELNSIKLNYGISVLPTIAGMSPHPFVGTQGFMIRRSSLNKDLAKEFIEKYLLTQKAVSVFYEHDPRIPARIDVLKALSQTQPYLEIFRQSVENGHPMPNIPEMGSIWGGMGKALSLMIDQNLSSAESLNIGVKQIRNELKKQDPKL